MRVQDSNLNSVSINTLGTGRTDTTKGGGSTNSSAQAASSQDQFSLSDLGSLAQSVSGDTPERTSRVSQLAAAYKSGNYHVNAQVVAQGIVNESLSAG